MERTRKPKVIYTDISKEFGKSREDLSWNHCTSTPICAETHGIAESAVRRFEEGAYAVLVAIRSGCKNGGGDSMEFCCYLRNIQDLFSDGKTPYERRFGVPFNVSVIPFRAMVECHLISVKDLSRLRDRMTSSRLASNLHLESFVPNSVVP